MPRRNLTGGWGESRVVTVRLVPADTRLLRELAAAWGLTGSEAIRRAIHEAAARMPAPVPVPRTRRKKPAPEVVPPCDCEAPGECEDCALQDGCKERG